MSSDIRVAFLGDSFTLGTGDDTGLGWVGRVLAAERGRGHDLTAYNLGVRRQTGAQIADRAESEADIRIRGVGDRQGLVLSFGANDIAQDRPQDESASAAADILQWAAMRDYRAFMVGAPAGADPELDAARELLNLRLEQVADSFAVPFLDIRAKISDWTVWHAGAAAGDGVHPGAEGYRKVAEAFSAWSAWRAWIAEG